MGPILYFSIPEAGQKIPNGARLGARPDREAMISLGLTL